ncbi:hypothetical protein OIDMADRAFT_100340 [Oidiodendron maius Zn]|uniref:ER transporter 6TM N-terminal domain-containing protein n=1 Tax=Oidiodendron maius (strain Zn) TaxID=913774 RepID=A0A0C3HK94_OIDMZ|nr:hypothetical protein OIDMADRAFT_100340 [Oidiodendron maius Zn]
MGKAKKYSKGAGEWVEKTTTQLWQNLQTNHLWQRILKNTLATTIAVIISILPAVVRIYGKAAYLAPMATVFGHPGRRFGEMAEALVLTLVGTVIGLGWSTLGVYLSSLLFSHDAPAAYTVKAVFLAIALLLHGFLRSYSPRLFISVLLLIIVCVVNLTGTSTAVSRTIATQILYPILTAVAILLLINVFVFPEFSARFLGHTTIDTLEETVRALRDAGNYFIHSMEALDGDKDERPDKHPESQGNPGMAELKHVEMNKILKPIKLETLSGLKSKLRTKLAGCKAAQQECNFELAWGVLPPHDLKPISVTAMRDLVANAIALIGNCESKYALMGDRDDVKIQEESAGRRSVQSGELLADNGQKTTTPLRGPDSSQDESEGKSDTDLEMKERKRKRHKSKSKSRLETDRENLELVKPRKEIESGDIELLQFLVRRIAKPLADLQEKIDRGVDVVTICLAYCYDVPRLPSGARRPTGIELEEVDIRIDILVDALKDFDRDSASALEGAAALHDLDQRHIDIMPRMEIFLISSFLLNLRQAALRTLDMLKHSRDIVEKYQARHERSRLYAPKIYWRKWLASGGEADMMALPEAGRKQARSGKTDSQAADTDPSSTEKKSPSKKKNDIESSAPGESRPPQPAEPTTREAAMKTTKSNTHNYMHKLRNGLADTIEYLSASDDFTYAVKVTAGVFAVTWPAFVPSWNTWYSLNRGLWAALQLVLITEVAIGTSIRTFALRAVGTTLGCLWGYAAYGARDGDRIVGVVMLVIGIVPSAYVMLNSPYVKAGMVSIISMCIVLLATVDQTVPGTATETFLKRLIAFLIGGAVALIVEVVLFPVRARDRLVESLAASMRQIGKMEGCLAYGIETETNIDPQSAAVFERFWRAKGKAEGALAAAQTFLPFCATEPRLKGSFKGMALIYTEILYVLHSIVDRMDNMLYMRQEYGSGVLEELNAEVYPYRRNIAGAITLNLFAVREALITKLPLPQFFPSARLAHLRMVNRVREVMTFRIPSSIDHNQDSGRSEMELTMVKRVVRQKYLSWNAASAGQIEIIEYLEELIDLVKLLVGVNEFRSGLLTRPTYRDYVARITGSARNVAEEEAGAQPTTPASMDQVERDELLDTVPEPGTTETRMIPSVRRGSTFNRSQEGLRRRRTHSSGEAERELPEEGELPLSLQRVRSKRMEEMSLRLEKSRSSGSETAKGGKSVDKR